MESGLPVVRVLPLGVDIPVEPGESLMRAAQRAGYVWPTRCRGMALCTACTVEVESGATNFNGISEIEAEALEHVRTRKPPGERELRLACQAEPRGDAVVVKRGVRVASESRPSLPDFYI